MPQNTKDTLRTIPKTETLKGKTAIGDRTSSDGSIPAENNQRSQRAQNNPSVYSDSSGTDPKTGTPNNTAGTPNYRKIAGGGSNTDIAGSASFIPDSNQYFLNWKQIKGTKISEEYKTEFHGESVYGSYDNSSSVLKYKSIGFSLVFLIVSIYLFNFATRIYRQN